MTTTPPPPQAFQKSETDEVDGGLAPGTEGLQPKERKLSRLEKRAIAAKGRLSSPWASGIAIVLAVLWTIPTFGLLVTSFRPSADIRTNGWWNVFTQPSFTLDNYVNTLVTGSDPFIDYVVNTIVITLPSGATCSAPRFQNSAAPCRTTPTVTTSCA